MISALIGTAGTILIVAVTLDMPPRKFFLLWLGVSLFGLGVMLGG